MSEEAHGLVHAPASNSISVPFVVASALISTLGLLALLLWVITFQWILFLGVIPMTIGALMFFHPKMGANRSG